MGIDENSARCGCHYNDFDPATLAPRNEITEVRLRESQLFETDFTGKTVLDIGCNLGLFSLLAAKRGASRVIGIDVTPEFIARSNESREVFLGHVGESAREKMNVEFQHCGIFQLDDTHKSDIVLCYAVLHWLADQGRPMDMCIRKLRELTGEELLLEFPWDASEPSLRARNVSPDVYNAEIIFRELLDHFQNVRILRFTKYMNDPRAKRVLVHASCS